MRNLKPAAVNLSKATPNLSSTFVVLNHLFNILGYSPGGGQHGYLWWLAWLDHNARTLFSVQDANGVFRPLFLQFSCQQLGMLANPPSVLPGLGAVAGLLNTSPANAACQAAGLGTTSPTGGLPPLPPLPLGLSKDNSSSTSSSSSSSQATAAKSSTASSQVH